MLKFNDKNYFSYETIGEFHSDTEWIHPTRTIDSFELIFVSQGTVYIEENGEKYTLEKNEAIILEPGLIHGGWQKSLLPTDFYWFHFKTDQKIPFKTLKNNKNYDIKYLLKKLLHMSKTPSYEKEALDSAALLLFHELKAAEFSCTESSIAHKTAEYIRINSDKNITAAKVSSHFGYNPDYMSKLFKKTFGTGIKTYIYKERMNKARDLLLNTDLSVKEIASRLSFPEENSFIKFFSYHDQISPAKFRNNYFNIHLNNK